MSKHDYFSNALLNKLLRGTAFTVPSPVYMALFSVAPTKSTSGTELSYSGYGRVTIDSSIYGTPASGGSMSNTAAIVFGTKADAGTVNAVAAAFFDASSGGNMLCFSIFPTSRAITQSDTPRFAVGNATVVEA